MGTRFASLLFAAALLTLTLTAQERLDRVITPPALPPDARLGEPVHLDKPFTFTPKFTTADDWKTRAAALRTQVQVSLGLWPMPTKTPLRPVIHGRIERDGYTIEKVFFASAPGHYVSGNLYRPSGRAAGSNSGAASASAGARVAAGASVKRPGVLSPHGHWPGQELPSGVRTDGRLYERPEADAREKVKAGGDQTFEGARYPHQARAAGLARLGAVVFMFDMVGYADSRPIVHREGFNDAEAELRLQSTLGLQMWNATRALDFLASLPDVDPSRLAVTGESGGGTQTFLLAALDDRPAAVFPAVMVGGAMQGGCVCENAPLLRIGTNNIEIAALFAPKPLGLSGADDWTKDIMTLGLPELKSIYRLYGADAESRVMARYFPYEHNFNQTSRELMYGWFNTHLRLGHTTGADGTIAETPFTPATPAELSVYDASHPRPKDAADAATLRKTLTSASDAQMASLAAKPGEYRAVVESALRAMVQEPKLASVATAPRPNTFKTLPGDGFESHLTLLTRRGPDGAPSGDAVPTLGLVPKGFKGDTVIVWAHPGGKASLFEADGRTPVVAARAAIASGAAILAPDVFLTGEFNLNGQKTALTPVKNEQTFATYNHGYNLTVLAQRVRDLTTAVAFAKGTLKPKTIHLVGFDGAGTWALLARALAADTITRASIDLDGFDFDQVTSASDERMLPGALKYGGVHGFLSLLTSGQTEIYAAPPRPASVKAPATPSVTVREGEAAPEAMIRWVLGA
jgi:dienelactone hydrolase